MARSSCTSCGLRRRHCYCSREASTTEEGEERAFKLTRTSFWITYLVTIFSYIIVILVLLLCLVALLTSKSVSTESCHLEVFVDSFSVSKAIANTTADWNVNYVTKTPGNGCKGSLHMVKSRLYQGDKLISESKAPDYVGKQITGNMHGLFLYSVFKNIVTPIGDVVWDLRVQVVSSIKLKDSPDRFWGKDGFLIMKCEGIPVNFTLDVDGNMKGSLIGYKRSCEYLFRDQYWDVSFFF